jgi:hypothetical protein
MVDPIEALVKRHVFALTLLTSKWQVDSDNTLRLLRNMERELQEWLNSNSQDRGREDSGQSAQGG